MIGDLRDSRMARAAIFVAAHVLIVLLVLQFVVWPFWARIDARREEQAALATKLRRAQSMDGRIKALSAKGVLSKDLFLSGGDERLASADLQAILQRKAKAAGTRFLGLRGEPAASAKGSRTVSARLDVEGPAASIRTLLADIEAGTPFLFVTSTVLRSDNQTAAPAGQLRAELVVEATMGKPASPGAPELRGMLAPAAAMGSP